MQKSLRDVSDGQSYYLAVIRPENLQRLQETGLGFYAVKKGRDMNPGDRIVLYRSRGGRVGGPGVVGAFEVLATPQTRRRVSGADDLWWALYPIQIPWRAIVLSLTEPMPIGPLVSKLAIFPNKEKYGSVLQTTMKRLPKADYELIEKSLKAHASRSGEIGP